MTGAPPWPSSTAALLVSMFNAVLDARYECQPPSRFSRMLDTRADRLAATVGAKLAPLRPAPAAAVRRSSGANAFSTSVGPMAFTWYACIIDSAVTAASAVSGGGHV